MGGTEKSDTLVEAAAFMLVSRSSSMCSPSFGWIFQLTPYVINVELPDDPIHFLGQPQVLWLWDAVPRLATCQACACLRRLQPGGFAISSGPTSKVWMVVVSRFLTCSANRIFSCCSFLTARP